MDAAIKHQIEEIKTMLEEIHAAIIAGEKLTIRKPGQLAIKLAARKMLNEQGKPRPRIGKCNLRRVA